MKALPVMIALLLLSPLALAIEVPDVPQEKIDKGFDLFSGFLHNGENMMNGIADIAGITAGMLAYVLLLLLLIMNIFSKQLSKFIMIFGVILFIVVVMGLL